MKTSEIRSKLTATVQHVYSPEYGEEDRCCWESFLKVWESMINNTILISTICSHLTSTSTSIFRSFKKIHFNVSLPEKISKFQLHFLSSFCCMRICQDCGKQCFCTVTCEIKSVLVEQTFCLTPDHWRWNICSSFTFHKSMVQPEECISYLSQVFANLSQNESYPLKWNEGALGHSHFDFLNNYIAKICYICSLSAIFGSKTSYLYSLPCAIDKRCWNQHQHQHQHKHTPNPNQLYTTPWPTSALHHTVTNIISTPHPNQHQLHTTP